ncbi:MAG: hypothetical protein LBK63_07095 [Treponema sp.]|jgi:hypothetical protein|nr:hypothetical protein [Treponema sp.]
MGIIAFKRTPIPVDYAYHNATFTDVVNLLQAAAGTEYLSLTLDERHAGGRTRTVMSATLSPQPTAPHVVIDGGKKNLTVSSVWE